ncbi:heavy metal-binding domain-containing protein [uncultured Photobacterium sp.]|uniref:YbjQ family protein n=1 Tax=uncultured Photobacterium sp. TaxID=173973 RepID=UPI002639ECCA|nr:heavy metal-binding domain-containing protein [uncultured Photobacterium sp.]
MIFSTTETVPGYEITAILGIVTGNVVQSKHIGRDIMAGLKTIIGGELKGYTEMFNEARSQAMARLEADATALGADAVIGLRFTTSAIMDGSCELLAFGTAITLQQR